MNTYIESVPESLNRQQSVSMDKIQQFCAFCLRAKPPDVEFYKHVIGTTVELQTALQLVLSYDFRLENFAICMPCWKIMLLIQGFRTRCKKANGLVERIGIEDGLKRGEDSWFSASTLEIIESIRTVVKDQLGRIEREAERVQQLELCGAGVQPMADNVQSTLDVGEVKIEPEEESERDDQVSPADGLHSTLDIGEVKIELGENEVVKDQQLEQCQAEVSPEAVLESTLDIGEVKIEPDKEEMAKDQPKQVAMETEQQTKQCDVQVTSTDVLQATLDIGKVKIEPDEKLVKDQQVPIEKEADRARLMAEVGAKVIEDQLLQIKKEPDQQLNPADVLESTLDIGEVKVELASNENIKVKEEVLENIATEVSETERSSIDPKSAHIENKDEDSLKYITCLVEIKNEPEDDGKPNDAPEATTSDQLPNKDFTAEEFLESILDVGEAKIEGEEVNLEDVTEQSPFETIDIDSDTESEDDFYDISATSNKLDTSGLMQCAKCNRFFQPVGYKLHVLKCNGKRPFKVYRCPHCPVTFKKHHKLVGHVNRHAGKTPFHCRKGCKKGFAASDVRSRHELRCGLDVQQCIYCKKTLDNRLRLFEHYRLYHPKERRFSCTHCDKKFNKKINMQKHEERVHSGERIRKFPCELCDKSFAEEYYLKKHTNQVHSDENLFQCEQEECGRQFKTKFSLDIHYASKHPDLASETALRTQERMRQRKKEIAEQTDPLQITPFDCEICEKRLRSKLALQLHMAGKHPEQASERARKTLARVKARYRAVSSKRKQETTTTTTEGSNKRGRKSSKRKRVSSSESDTEMSEDNYAEESDTE